MTGLINTSCESMCRVPVSEGVSQKPINAAKSYFYRVTKLSYYAMIVHIYLVSKFWQVKWE